MRRAFTLIELLVIISIIGVMVTVAVVSVVQGQEYARMRGSVRTVFATIRQARSIALVSQKPSILTFSTKGSGDTVLSSIKITSSKLMENKYGVQARSLLGTKIILGSSEDSSESDRQTSSKTNPANSGAEKSSGHTVEEVLFAPVSEDVLTGVILKVVMDDDEEEAGLDRKRDLKKSKISVFSNVDFLLDKFKSHKEKEAEKKKEDSQTLKLDEVDTSDVNEERSVVWQINGRCEPHTIYIYPEDGTVDEAWSIRVDRFGGVKVVEDEED